MIQTEKNLNPDQIRLDPAQGELAHICTLETMS